MNTCYYCKKTIEDESQMLVKEINIGFLELSTTRETFHEECWAKWRHEKKMTMMKWFLGFALVIIVSLIILFVGSLMIRG